MLARRVGQRAAALRACRHASSQADAPPHPHLTYHMGERAIRLRSVERIASPLDALAMVRAVERRFGRVAEYRFHHDQEIPNRFQFVAYLSFWDPATYARVPRKEPILLRVKLPPENTSLTSGGVGLADLTPYLDPKNWTDNDLAAEVDAQFDQSDAPTDGSRILRFHVEHYSSRFQTRTPLPDNLSPADTHFRRLLMANFVRWGGFAPKNSLPAETRMTASHLVFGGGEVDHPYMRHQLIYWDTRLRPKAVDRPLVLPTKKADNVPAPAPEARLQPEETQPPIQHLDDLRDVVSDAESTDAPNSTDLSASQSAPSDAVEISPSPPPKSPSPSRFPSLAATSSRQSPPPPSPTRDQTETNGANPVPSSSAEPTRQAAASAPSSPSTASKPVVQTKPAPAPAAPERRNQARAARVVMQKIDPVVAATSKTTQTAPPSKQTQAQQEASKQQAAASAQKKKAKHRPAQRQEGKAAGQPIEVEERTLGMTSRLKGMFRGWV